MHYCKRSVRSSQIFGAMVTVRLVGYSHARVMISNINTIVRDQHIPFLRSEHSSLNPI